MKRLALLALIASCATPTTSTGVVTEGGARPAPVETASAPSPAPRPAHRVARKEASRSRPATADRTVAAGSHLSVTCYAATGNRTASGKWPAVGMAAGPWPFGTRLRVEGLGIVTVEDRYGHSTQLDVFGPSEGFCRRFGRRHLLVQVLP